MQRKMMLNLIMLKKSHVEEAEAKAEKQKFELLGPGDSYLPPLHSPRLRTRCSGFCPESLTFSSFAWPFFWPP